MAGRTPTGREAFPPPAVMRRRDRVFFTAAHAGLVLAVVVSAALVFGVAVGSAAWVPWFRLAAGAVLVVEGLLLAQDWRGARRHLVARQYHRMQSRRGGGGVPLTQLVLWRLVTPLLGVVGLAWFCVGAVATALGLAALL
jgi:hypothetical protein